MQQKGPSLFTRISKGTARLAGRPITFSVMLLVVIAWAASGPYFRFSDTWQLVINTGTTILTFLMVFLIQATQNRDAEAIQIKLDEIIRAIREADNALMDLEDLDEQELLKMRESYLALAEKARLRLQREGDGPPGSAVPRIDDARAKRAGQPKPRP